MIVHRGQFDKRMGQIYEKTDRTNVLSCFRDVLKYESKQTIIHTNKGYIILGGYRQFHW